MLSDNLTYEQCVAQGIGPLVFPERLVENGEQRAEMKAVCLQNMQQQVKLQHILQIAWQALEKADIHPVLLKGAGLAALYPSPERRQWGDIDLFVGKDQYHPACAVMRETFPKALKFDKELDHYKHYNLIADGISIEIHRVSVGLQHPIDERLYARMEAYGMSHGEHITVNGLTVTVPEPTFNALFVFLHSWEHVLSSGANLRQLYDLRFLLEHYKKQIDRPRLKRWLRALHLAEPWNVYMSIIEERGDARGERLLEDLLKGERKQEESEKTYTNRVVRKWHTMQSRMQNAKRIRRYSPSYARHMVAETLLHGALRFFAKDRFWE